MAKAKDEPTPDALSTPRDGGSTGFAGADFTYRMLLAALGIAVVITVSRNGQIGEALWRDAINILTLSFAVALGSIVTIRVLTSVWRGASVNSLVGVSLAVLVAMSVLVTEALVLAMYEFDVIAERWPSWHLPLVARTAIVTVIIGGFTLRFMTIQHRAKLESESKQADRLQALQSRIRPHFLFNSMNSIASLIRSDPELAEKALEDLADVFRVLLADARKMVPITAESELARQYLDIEKLRLGDRLNVKWTATNVPRSALVPSLTLQPLLENAVYHGIEPSFAGGTVSIQMWTEDDMLHILISNPLPEVSRNPHRKGNRIAMDNIRERLSSHFGGRSSLETSEKLGSFHAKLVMPIVRS